jgi:hypothetical protein
MCLTMGFRVSLQLKKRRLAWAVVLQVPPVCPTPALGTREILISGTPDRTERGP